MKTILSYDPATSPLIRSFREEKGTYYVHAIGDATGCQLKLCKSETPPCDWFVLCYGPPIGEGEGLLQRDYEVGAKSLQFLHDSFTINIGQDGGAKAELRAYLMTIKADQYWAPNLVTTNMEEFLNRVWEIATGGNTHAD